MQKLIGVLVFAALVVSGCGGGGGGGSGGNAGPVVSRQSFNIKTAIASYTSTPHSYTFTGSGTLNGAPITVTGTGDLSVLTAGVFEGQTALQQTETTNLTIIENGNPTPLSSVVTLFYLPADYSPLGSMSANRYVVNDPGTTYPTTAKVGDSGMVGSAKRYSDSTKSTLIRSATSSYRVEADTATSAIVNLVTVTIFIQPPSSPQTETIRYRLDSVGTFTLLSDSLVSAAGNLTIMPVN